MFYIKDFKCRNNPKPTGSFLQRLIQTSQRDYQFGRFDATGRPHIPSKSDAVPIFILLNKFLVSGHDGKPFLCFDAKHTKLFYCKLMSILNQELKLPLPGFLPFQNNLTIIYLHVTRIAVYENGIIDIVIDDALAEERKETKH